MTNLTHKEHVFVVDDDAQVRTMAANVLVTGNYTTHQLPGTAEPE
jgi:hypothetical protein